MAHVRDIDAEVCLIVDGDDTSPADIACRMVELVRNHQADMVVVDRLSSTYFTESKRSFHNFENSLVRSSIKRLFYILIKDIMTDFWAFSY